MGATAEPAEGPLAHVPVAFFAVSMGLAGLTLALAAGERALGLGGGLSGVLLAATGAAFAAIAGLYALKALRHPRAVAADWNHPVRLAFFPAISISVLLIATALLARAPALAAPLWIAGAVAQGVLTLAVISSWIGHRAYEQGHLTPAWFIPAVGNVVVPLAGTALGHGEIAWLFFSAGLVFWLVLLTMVFNRLVFHDPLPERLMPTLVILIAPPAVAYLAYLRLGGGIDPFARILLNSAYVFAAVVLTQAPRIARLPFALSWWALSFPIAALAVASLEHAAATGSPAHHAIGLALVGLDAAIVAGLALRTLVAMRAGAICRPE